MLGVSIIFYFLARTMLCEMSSVSIYCQILTIISATTLFHLPYSPSFLPSDAYDGTDVCEAKSNNGEVARATAQPRDLQNLRLCYAGHAIRADAVSPSASRNLAAFGEYSSHFSFSPGKGKDMYGL